MDPGRGQKISRAETLLGCGAFSDHLVHTKPFGLLERFGRNQGTKHSHLPWYQSGKSDHPCGTVPDPHCGAVWLGPGCQWRPRAFILHFFRPFLLPSLFRPACSLSCSSTLRPKPAIQTHTGADRAACPLYTGKEAKSFTFCRFPLLPGRRQTGVLSPIPVDSSDPQILLGDLQCPFRSPPEQLFRRYLSVLQQRFQQLLRLLYLRLFPATGKNLYS